MVRRKFVLACLLLGSGSALACLPLGYGGISVYTSTETALVAWDAAKQTEHFVRSAQFDTEAKNIGFLVPTPTVPLLAEAKWELFTLLDRISGEHEKGPFWNSPVEETATTSIEIIHHQSVSGYHATIFKATDGESAQKWLKDHQYPVGPEAKQWIEAYIKKGWVLTAFKLDNPSQGSLELELQPVRMSFKTDKPFYPYMEPRSKGSQARDLQVFVLGNTAFDATMNGQEWVGKSVWGGAITAEESKTVSAMLGVQGYQPTHLTNFEDNSSPRNGIADLYFTPVKPNPWKNPYLLGIPVFVIIFAAVRRRAKAGSTER